MCPLNFTSSSTISSRQFKPSRLTSTRLTLNGSISVVLQRRRDAKTVAKRGLDGLLAPRRGATATTNPLQESTENEQPAGPHQDLPLPLDNDTDEHTQPAPQQPAAPTATPLLQQKTHSAPARQTRSGRGIKNTPRYDQSISLRDQGIVAW